MDNDEHGQLNGDTSTAPTINQNDFNFLIDLLGTSDVEDVESVGVSANFDASFAVEDLLGLDASLGGIPENPAPVPQSVHDRSRVGREEDTGRLPSTAEEPLRANASTFTPNGTVLSPGILLHRSVNDTPNCPGSLCPSPSFPGQMRLSMTETPSSPQLAGADMSSLPISPLQLASRDFLPNDPDVNDVQFGQKQRGQRVSPRVAPSTRQVGNRSSHPDLSQTSSRAEMMDLFASSQAPIAQFSQVVSEVKQQVATLRQRIQKLDHDAREFAGEEVAEAAVRRARGGEPSSDLRRCLAGPGGREQRTHRMAFQGSSTAKPNSQSKQKSTDIDLTSLDVNSLSGHEARRLLSVIIGKVQATPAHSHPIVPHSLSDVERAIRLTIALDELVWRRSRPTQSRNHRVEIHDTFSEENVEAMLERIKLWERAARGRKNDS